MNTALRPVIAEGQCAEGQCESNENVRRPLATSHSDTHCFTTLTLVAQAPTELGDDQPLIVDQLWPKIVDETMEAQASQESVDAHIEQANATLVRSNSGIGNAIRDLEKKLGNSGKNKSKKAGNQSKKWATMKKEDLIVELETTLKDI